MHVYNADVCSRCAQHTQRLWLTLQLKLREMIEDATAKGELWTRQWDKVPLDAVFGQAPPVNAVVAAAQAAAARLNAGRQRASTWLPPGGLSCILRQSGVLSGETSLLSGAQRTAADCPIPGQAADTTLAPTCNVVHGTLVGR